MSDGDVDSLDLLLVDWLFFGRGVKLFLFILIFVTSRDRVFFAIYYARITFSFILVLLDVFLTDFLF